MVAEPNVGQIWTVEEYLDMERGSAIRHEFVGGRVYAMAGGNQRHSRIAMRVCSIVSAHFDGQPGSACQVFNADVKIRLANRRDHVYPDMSVACDERDLTDDSADFIRFPRLVVEVLSPSTQAYDRGARFDLYRQIDTLWEYVLVDIQRPAVEVRGRADGAVWSTLRYGPGDKIALASIDLTFPIAALYQGVRF